MPRKKKDVAEKYSYFIMVRFPMKHKAVIEEEAGKSKLTPSEWVRAAVWKQIDLNAPPPQETVRQVRPDW